MQCRPRLPLGFFYVAPMAVFLLLTTLEGVVPRSTYPFVYGLKLLCVGALLFWCVPRWRQEFRPDWRAAGLALGAGLAGFGFWVLLDPVTPHFAILGQRSIFNPMVEIGDSNTRLIFIAMRLFGMAVVVPVMEEVFWRSFLLRYLTDEVAWQRLPVGRYSWRAVGLGTLFFSLAHPEWLAAAVFAGLMTGLCRKTGNLFAATLAHGMTNLALGLYVLFTGMWRYW